MEISACIVNPVENMGRVKAFCTVTIDSAIVIRGIRIREGQNGLFVDFPERQKKDGEYEAIVRPASKESYQQFAQTVLTKYQEVLEQRARGQGEDRRSATERGYSDTGRQNTGYQNAGYRNEGTGNYEPGGYSHNGGAYGR